MRNRSLRHFSVGAVLIGSTLTGSVLTASAAMAGDGPETFNRANVVVSGGDARALSLCVNVARAYARAHRPVPTVQSNRCGGARAEGGSVRLRDVDVLVSQEGSGSETANSANVVISGGDATAIAACINYSQGTATAVQRNACAGARAQGGDVSLRNVGITVIQG